MFIRITHVAEGSIRFIDGRYPVCTASLAIFHPAFLTAVCSPPASRDYHTPAVFAKEFRGSGFVAVFSFAVRVITGVAD